MPIISPDAMTPIISRQVGAFGLERQAENGNPKQKLSLKLLPTAPKISTKSLARFKNLP
jgi:hypothetical protein